MTIALVTATAARGQDEDLEPLEAALSARGVKHDTVDWDDPTVDWSQFDAAVLRSTWDYTSRLAEFLSWVDRAGASTQLVNPPEIVRWNCDKRYLHDLASHGVGVVPTSFFDDAETVSFETSGEVVVKPSVSAGSRDTLRFRPTQYDAAVAHAQQIIASGRTAMVQPYQAAVDAEGETALLYFGGEFSHAIRKGPLLELDAEPTRALFAAEVISARVASAEQRNVAESVLSALRSLFGGVTPTYARIDLLSTAAGEQVVLEVELIEPSVFLATDSGAADRFASVLAGLSPNQHA